jgi:hypothetical protein
MKIIVKNIDIGGPIPFDEFCPEDAGCFGLWITALIGPDCEEGGHLFQILVCTPEWIRKEYLARGAVWGRYMLIVSCFDHEQVRNEIARYLVGCSGKGFWEMAQKIARIGAWEFEDYQP